MEWVDFGEAVNFIAFGSFINKPSANIEERSVAKLRNEAAALLCRQKDLTINAVFNKAVCFNGGQWPLRATHTIEINLPDVGEETAEIEIPKTFETINDFLKRQKADGMDISGYVISIKNENEAVAYDTSAAPNPEFYFSCPHFSKHEIESRFPVSLLKTHETEKNIKDRTLTFEEVVFIVAFGEIPAHSSFNRREEYCLRVAREEVIKAIKEKRIRKIYGELQNVSSETKWETVTMLSEVPARYKVFPEGSVNIFDYIYEDTDLYVYVENDCEIRFSVLDNDEFFDFRFVNVRFALNEISRLFDIPISKQHIKPSEAPLVPSAKNDYYIPFSKALNFNDILIDFDTAVRIAAFGSIEWEEDNTAHRIAYDNAKRKICVLFREGKLFAAGFISSESKWGKNIDENVGSPFNFRPEDYKNQEGVSFYIDTSAAFEESIRLKTPIPFYEFPEIEPGDFGLFERAYRDTWINNICFLEKEIRKHFPTPVFDLLTKKPQAVSEDVSALQSEISGLKAENARLKEQLNATGIDADGYGYRLPGGYRTEFLEVIFETLKKYSPTGDKKENLKAALKQTAQEKGLYGNRQISDSNIDAMATICRSLSDKTGGYIK